MIQLICLGWVLGVATMGQQLSLLQSLLIPSMCLFVLFTIVKLIFFKKKSVFWFKSVYGLICLTLGIGVGYHYALNELNARLQRIEKQTQSVEVIAYIKNLNELSEQSTQQKIQVLNRHAQVVEWQAFLKDQSQQAPVTTLELGQYYRLSGQIRPAHSYATQGAFDQEKWYVQQNIMSGFKVNSAQKLSEQQVYALGYATYIRKQHSFFNSFRLGVEQQRLALRHFIHQQPLNNKGLVLALLTGDKSLLSLETEHLFQRFGMSHLLAISGPHVLIFALLVCWVLNQLIGRYVPQAYLKWPKQYVLLFPFCFCVLLYCAFVGFEIPALRTLLSCLLISGFLIFKRKIRPLQILLLSASILLLFDPFSILSAAFWLSYGACFVLLRIYQTLQQRKNENIVLTRFQIIKLHLAVLIESQWKIFLALFPLMMIFFKQIAWITPLSNLFAIPWISLVIVPLDIIAAFTYFIFKPLGSLIFQINDLCVSFLLVFMQGLDHVFSPQLQPIAMSFWVLACVCLGLIILFIPRGVIPKAWAIVCFIPLIYNDKQKNEFELTVLDVGQGQAIFLQDQANNLMIDMGGNYDEQKFSIGKSIILPFLSVKGIGELNQLILTHLDQDHSGAYQSIKHDLSIQNVYSNEQVAVESPSQFNYCYQGQKWSWADRVEITVLSPKQADLANAKYEKNEHSCVIYVQIKHAKEYQNFLFMGDAGWQTEYHILKEYPNLKVDVLVLGHHGSRHSSAYDFLKQLKPKLAIASAGFNNRYGHPSELVQSRLKQLNIPLLTTIHQGSIRFSMSQEKEKVEFQRDQRLWLKN